jgi:hypothetical protein
MPKKIAEIISLVLNPLVVLIPVPFFLIFETTDNLTLSLRWTGISIFFIVVFFLLILVGIKFGVFSDLDISKREQRPIAFLVGLFLAIIYLIFLFLFHSPGILQMATFALMLGVIVIGVVNTFTKVSWHLAVLSAFLTFLLLAGEWKGLLGILLIPLLAWARIKTKNHTLLQTVLGSIIGILTTIVIYVIVKYIVR